MWWRRRESREEWKNATTKWLRYYIYDADTFTPYDLKVQAVNDFGLGPESPVVTGYSGEDREYQQEFTEELQLDSLTFCFGLINCTETAVFPDILSLFFIEFVHSHF